MSEFKTILEPAAMRFLQPLAFPELRKCERILNVSLFFDGTDNNHNEKPENVRTNISRLWSAYTHNPKEGHFRHYVSGVGTPFSELKKAEAEAFGGPAGVGGEARIIYGLLQVINSVHASVNSLEPRFKEPELAALCSSTKVPPRDPDVGNRPYRLSAEQKILDDLGMPCGLVGAGDRSFLGIQINDERSKFFAKVRDELRRQVTARETDPKIEAVYFDVFGFSRGAAQARVFVSWLHKYLLQGGQLFGVPSCVRMLGLFDTVASVGLTNAVGNAGHNDWAQAQDLRVHPDVRNCLHFVALHELRTNFPVDSVAVGGSLPPNCQEHHCPGAHSDVGGGYAAGEQGKGVRLAYGDPRNVNDRYPVPDANARLSNLPLKQMYDAAIRACVGHCYVPWVNIYTEEEKREGALWSVFGLDGIESVRQHVASYFASCGVPAGLNTRDALRQHGLRYLAWRYQVTKQDCFNDLQSVGYAQILDAQGLAYCVQGQRLFKQQIDLIERPRGSADKEVMDGFNRHAGEIYAEMKKTRLSANVGYFFDAMVHDSYAGFIGQFHAKEPNWVKTTGSSMMHRIAEAQRYVRWREIYQGSNEGLNALVDPGTGNYAARAA